MSLKLEISDYYELLALHRALLEAKFSLSPNDTALPGSSFIADIANRVVDLLAQKEVERGRPDKAEGWKRWRTITPGHRVWGIALHHAHKVQESNLWSRWSVDEKRQYVHILVSPYILSDDDLMQFIAQVDAAHMEGSGMSVIFCKSP